MTAWIDRAQASKVINALTPTGTSAAPGSFTTISGTAMKIRLNSTSSTAAAAGTELTGTGYTAGGMSVPETVDASSSGSAVTIPKTTAMEWTNGSGGTWSIQSFDLTGSSGTRSVFADFNGAPISVADGNTFRLAVGAISVGIVQS